MRRKPMIRLGKYVISEDSPCFVIAEIGHSHQGKIETAKKLVAEPINSILDDMNPQHLNLVRWF